MKSILFLIFIYLIGFVYPNFCEAQQLQGQWRDHLSYKAGYRIADAGDLVYCATEKGMKSYNRITEEILKYSKVSGLNDVNVSTIAYNEETEKLLIAYINGNLDILRNDGSILNLPDIKLKRLTGIKQVNKIYFHEDIAYLATGFGIVSLDMKNEEFRETYSFGPNGTNLFVNDICIKENTIYAATEIGIYTANLNSPNLIDFQYWHTINHIPQANSPYKQIENHNNKLLAVYTDAGSNTDQIIEINSDNYTEWNIERDAGINDICSSNGSLTISCPSRGLVFNSNDTKTMDFVSYGIEHIYVDASETVFVAASYNGFNIQVDNETTRWLVVSGPYYSEVSKVFTLDDQVWVSSGGPERFTYHGAAYSFIDNKWESYISSDHPNDTMGNTFKIAIDPRDYNHVWLGTHRYGLLEVLDGEIIKLYDENNTELLQKVPSNVETRISGIEYDLANNLWFVVDYTPNPLFRISAEGEWQNPATFSSGLLVNGRNEFTDLLVTSNNQIWISSLVGGIVVVQPDNEGGFTERSFMAKNQEGNVLTRVYCLEEDNEGNVWAGTNAGPLVYPSPSSVFTTTDVIGIQTKVARNDGTGTADFLLGSEVILDIEVDGGNRKWIGTDNSGVFLMSADNKETLINFREENSKLLANNVSGIGVNEKTGEIFFATTEGLVSYMGVATKGFDEYTDVYVYPNPVRPEFEGNITIKGLVENSIVKITDISGNLVWETESLGGQAIWDGRNFDGNKVASGIYLVLLATPDGLKSHITKLLFLN